MNKSPFQRKLHVIYVYALSVFPKLNTRQASRSRFGRESGFASFKDILAFLVTHTEVLGASATDILAFLVTHAETVHGYPCMSGYPH